MKIIKHVLLFFSTVIWLGNTAIAGDLGCLSLQSSNWSTMLQNYEGTRSVDAKLKIDKVTADSQKAYAYKLSGKVQFDNGDSWPLVNSACLEDGAESQQIAALFFSTGPGNAIKVNSDIFPSDRKNPQSLSLFIKGYEAKDLSWQGIFKRQESLANLD